MPINYSLQFEKMVQDLSKKAAVAYCEHERAEREFNEAKKRVSAEEAAREEAFVQYELAKTELSRAFSLGTVKAVDNYLLNNGKLPI